MIATTVLSWNILSQFCINEQKSELSWNVRLPCILKILEQSNADIILLQEVDLEHFENDFASLLVKYSHERHKIILKGKHQRTNPFGNVTLWKMGTLVNTIINSRCLHIELILQENQFIVTNVHFPAKNGLEGYKEKLQHFISCTKVWKDTNNVIFGGDFNDGLCFKDTDGKIIGLGCDVKESGFIVPPEELSKLTCKGRNLSNVDHILVRGKLKASYMPCLDFDVHQIPNSLIPSDHIPVLYTVSFL
jgi:endonuclease/exonuclease/phosphatase family metal-dependent hydrolase